MCLSPEPLNGGRSGCIGSTFGRSASWLSLETATVSTSVGVQGPGSSSSAHAQSVHAQSVDSQNSQSLQIVLIDESQSQSVRSSFSTQNSRVTWNACKDALESCHRQFLIKRVHELEGKCQEYQKALKKAKRENKFLVEKQDKQKCRELVPHEPTDLEITKGKVRLTKRGFVNMGIRKALALTSAVGFPLVTLTETSRQTVARSEAAVWSMLVIRTAVWHNCVFEALSRIAKFYRRCKRSTSNSSDHVDFALVDDQADQLVLVTRDLLLPRPADWLVSSWAGDSVVDENKPQFTLGGTALAGDATNSGIWRRNKLQSLFVTSAVMCDSGKLDSSVDWHEAFAHHTTVCL